jgi:PDZ domain-containing protein
MDVWTYLWTKWRGESEIIPTDQYFGGVSPDESRQVNLDRMTTSKDTAIAVALDRLGYDMISDAGVIVAQVVAGSPADGILAPGDVLLAIDGAPITSDVQLVDRLKAYAPGDAVTLDVTRTSDQANAQVRITLGENPSRPGSSFIGIAPATLADIATPPFPIDIDSGSVGGPSAGLAFTLGILDDLTPGDLSGGNDVAITGTIGIDGQVGAIGGIEQKAIAVRKSGSSVFIVPASQQPEEIEKVKERLGSDVELILVENLDQALDALSSIGGDVGAVQEFALANN